MTTTHNSTLKLMLKYQKFIFKFNWPCFFSHYKWNIFFLSAQVNRQWRQWLPHRNRRRRSHITHALPKHTCSWTLLLTFLNQIFGWVNSHFGGYLVFFNKLVIVYGAARFIYMVKLIEFGGRYIIGMCFVVYRFFHPSHQFNETIRFIVICENYFCSHAHEITL